MGRIHLAFSAVSVVCVFVLGYMLGRTSVQDEVLGRSLQILRMKGAGPDHVATDRMFRQVGEPGGSPSLRPSPPPPGRPPSHSGPAPTTAARSSGGARVYRWNGSQLTLQENFCSGDLKFKKAILRTAAGQTPIYIHETVDDVWVSGEIARQGTYSSDLISIMTRTLDTDPNMGVLDLGSNVGVFTLSAAKQKRHVIAVDPLLENMLRLCKSVQDGGLSDYVSLVYAALSDRRGAVTFERHKGNVGGTSVKLTTAQYSRSDPNFMEVILMDDLLPLVRSKNLFLKMDIETQEFRALSSGTKLLDKVRVEGLLMEWSIGRDEGARCAEFLSKRNFVPYTKNDARVPLSGNHTENFPRDVWWKLRK